MALFGKILISICTVFIFAGCAKPTFKLTDEMMSYRCFDGLLYVVYRYKENVTINQVMAPAGVPRKCTYLKNGVMIHKMKNDVKEIQL